MIKVTFKEPQKFVDFSFVPSIEQYINHIFCKGIKHFTSSNDFASLVKGEILIVRITNKHIDNIQSIEHVKPTDLQWKHSLTHSAC